MNTPAASLPISKARKIALADPAVTSVPPSAAQSVAKAAELFVAALTRSAAHNSVDAGRKTVSYDDVAASVARESRLSFLVATVPLRAPLKK
jgi:histone H3/H4